MCLDVVGQRDHLLYNVTASYLVGPTEWETRTEMYNSNQVNPRLDPGDFVFTPPPGGREVGDMSAVFPGGGM